MLVHFQQHLMQTKKKIIILCHVGIESVIKYQPISVFKTGIILKPKLWHRDRLFVVRLGLVPCSDSSNRQTHCNVCRSQTAAGHCNCSIAFQWIHWFLHAAISWYNGKDGASWWCNHELIFFLTRPCCKIYKCNRIQKKQHDHPKPTRKAGDRFTNMDTLFQNEIFSSSFS